MSNTKILKSKNIELIKKSLSNSGIYHGELSEKALLENFEHYIKIGRISE